MYAICDKTLYMTMIDSSYNETFNMSQLTFSNRRKKFKLL